MGKLSQDYFLIRSAFPEKADYIRFPVTVQQLAEILYCTPRNAKNILLKMIELKWIDFEPGKGRGNASQLCFLANMKELLIEETKSLALAGKMDEALILIKKYGDDESKSTFISWLSDFFGYKVSSDKDQYVETLRMPIYRRINTLDPASCFYRLDAHMIKQIYDTLVEYNYETRKLTGRLAHHWKKNIDATQWIFYIRKGIKFHNGKEFNAEDVIFSLNRLKTEFPNQNWLVKEIEEIIPLSKYSVCIKLKKPNYVLPQYFAYTPTSIKSSDGAAFNGTGPYRLKENTSGKCVLEAWDYHFSGRALVDQVELIHIPEGEEIISEEEGRLLQIHAGEGEKEREDSWNGTENFLAGSTVLTLNLKKESPLNDHRFRIALSKLINRRQLLVELGEPRFYPASGFHVNMLPTITDRDFSQIQGLKLLKESIYDGEELTIYTYRRHQTDALWLKHYLVSFGIKLNVSIFSWDDLQRPEVQMEADMILFEAVLSEGDIQFFDLLQSGYSFIKNHLNEELYDDINNCVDSLVAEASSEVRLQKIHDLEKRLKESAAVIFLCHKNVIASSHPSLKGVKVNEKGWIDFKDVWIDDVSFKK